MLSQGQLLAYSSLTKCVQASDYVERGTQFTVDYGDIDAWFYESLESMFSKVLETLQKSDEGTVDHFLPRLESIVYRAHNIGWGYYDAISDMLKKAFP